MAENANVPQQVKSFNFSPLQGSNSENITIKIPEQLQAAYSLYTWPCAAYLAWYLYENRVHLPGKRLLELGAGTSLPSILAVKCGAEVIITDCALLPGTLHNIHSICQLNQLPNDRYRVLGLTWGHFTNALFDLPELDMLIASDCFYEPQIFEDILVTVSYILKRNPGAKFVVSYQERSADWSIECLLKKWNLTCRVIDFDILGSTTRLDSAYLVREHSIHLLQISLNDAL